jgi:hypothetical protein
MFRKKFFAEDAIENKFKLFMSEEGGEGEGGSGGGSEGSGEGEGGSGGGSEGSGEGATKNWYEGADPELVGHIQNKGWDDPIKAAKAHRELEKAFGKGKIALPEDDASDEEMNKFYSKLGRPESADKYELKKADGVEVNADFESQFKNWAFDAGLNLKQTQKLFDKALEFSQSAVASQGSDMEQLSLDGKKVLETDWGAEFNNKIEAAKRALKNYGVKNITTDDFMVNPELLKIISDAGQKYMEDNLHNGDGNNIGGMTAEQARARKDELLSDEKYKTSYLGGDKKKVAEINKLDFIAAGGK